MELSIFSGQDENNGFYKWWSVFSLLLEKRRAPLLAGLPVLTLMSGVILYRG